MSAKDDLTLSPEDHRGGMQRQCNDWSGVSVAGAVVEPQVMGRDSVKGAA